MWSSEMESIKLTPGVSAATTIRTIDNPRSTGLIRFEIWGCPSRACCRSRSAAFMNQFLDSTFSIVRNPSARGKAIVGSECARDVSVRKLSESKGVGSVESRFKSIVNPINTGSWDNGGIIIDGNGLHRNFLRSAFRCAVTWARRQQAEKTIEKVAHTSLKSFSAWYFCKYSLFPLIRAACMSLKIRFARRGRSVRICGSTTSCALRMRRFPCHRYNSLSISDIS